MAMATMGGAQKAPPCPVLTGLAAYLRRCGGKDTLHFETVGDATEAARAIRARNEPNVEVAAQYFRVLLSLA